MTVSPVFARDGRGWNAALGGMILLSVVFLTAPAYAGGPWSGAPFWTEPPSVAPAPPPSPVRRENEDAVFRPGKAAFTAWIGNSVIRYAVQATTVLPGEKVHIRVSGESYAAWRIDM